MTNLVFYRYVDFTSLYPWCNKSTEVVVGHPEIITENFDDISTYFGLIKCTVLPPKGLLHPVLPYRTKDKLMFPLCKTCTDTLNQNPCTHSEQERAILGTWCHVELMKAIEKGYQILKIHEVWHFPEHTDELFKGYVNTVIYVHKPGKPDPPLGNYLGDLTDELNGDYITSFVSGGPKNYAYRTKKGKTDTKIRGITLDYAATGKLNHDVVRALVHLHTNCDTNAKITIDMPFKITRDKKEKNIVTKRMRKDYRVVYNKRVITENYETLPYGY